MAYVFGLAVMMPAAYAQEDPAAISGKPSWLITPSVTGSATLTDNGHPGQGLKQSDFITSVTPAIRIDGKGGRVSGNLNFSWQQNIYANESAFNNDQKSLAATGKAELIEQWLFLDASANIAQRPTSVFGTQNVGNELVNANRGQTTSYQWSPYVQGRLAGSADYELRYRNSLTSAASGVYSTASGVDAQTWSGRLSGATPLTLLGWSVNAESQIVQFGSNRDTKSSRLLGTLDFRIDPQVKLFLSAGREADNYSSFDLQNRTTSGYGVDWAPTERTLLSLKKDRRSFGDGHSFEFSHRTALSAWKIIDSRSAIVPAQQLTVAPVSTAYDLLYLQLASSIPDPVQRAQAASLLLQLAGIPANSLIYGNIMSSQPFIQRLQQASVALMGVNNTVTFSAQRSSSQRIGTGVSTLDDFALSANIRQSGLSGSWAHKLTPHSTLTLNALTSRSKGDTTAIESRLRSLSLLLTSKIGARTTASLGLRQNSFDNTSGIGSGYDEHAITGSLSASF
ncbi:MAG: TIGR03016 family PEP-CTERM system-associated outer membrane protein [Rhodocyclaceae bacterium]|nr:TIGR03016 family PEP-CTERM system-associated outer membrane protein [Rhodocyclaceae bacterium]